MFIGTILLTKEGQHLDKAKTVILLTSDGISNNVKDLCSEYRTFLQWYRSLEYKEMKIYHR